jgi:hypothetical protein
VRREEPTGRPGTTRNLTNPTSPRSSFAAAGDHLLRRRRDEVALAAAHKICVASLTGTGGVGGRCRERELAVMDPRPRRHPPPLLHPASLHRLPDHGAPSAALAWEPRRTAPRDLVSTRHRRRAPSCRRPARPAAPQPRLLCRPGGLHTPEREGSARPTPPSPPRHASVMPSTSPIPPCHRAPSRRRCARLAAPSLGLRTL